MKGSPMQRNFGIGSPLNKKGLFERVVGKKFKDTKIGKTKVGQDITKAGKKIKGEVDKHRDELKDDIKELKKKLGLTKEEEERTDIITKEIKDQSDRPPGPESTAAQDPADIIKVKDKTPDIGDDWTSGKGDDPWEYKKIDGGYQTRKGPNGNIVNVTDPKSKAYQAIGEKIFDIEPVEINVEDIEMQPKRKKSSPYTPGYIRGYKGYGE